MVGRPSGLLDVTGKSTLSLPMQHLHPADLPGSLSRDRLTLSQYSPGGVGLEGDEGANAVGKGQDKEKEGLSWSRGSKTFLRLARSGVSLKLFMAPACIWMEGKGGRYGRDHWGDSWQAFHMPSSDLREAAQASQLLHVETAWSLHTGPMHRAGDSNSQHRSGYQANTGQTPSLVMHPPWSSQS